MLARSCCAGLEHRHREVCVWGVGGGVGGGGGEGVTFDLLLSGAHAVSSQ